jgi:DDE family transposase
MRSPMALYSCVLRWLIALGVCRHATAVRSLAALVTALLVGQSLRPAVLLRSWLSPTPVPARQGFKRLARAFDRPWLASAHLTPLLVRAVLALVPTTERTYLALDGVRCGRWEVLVLGVVWHKRVLPVGWAVLPWPWPKGRLKPTTCALIRQVAAVWPAERPAHLLADRGFPSRDLFRTVEAVGWEFTVRLGARTLVTVDGKSCWAKELLATARSGRWQVYPRATYGSAAPLVRGALMVGKDLPVLPRHQANPGSLAQRARRAHRRLAEVGRKHRAERGTSGDAAATEQWVIVFTTHATARQAAASYRQRWPLESSFRDAQGGWDGRSGWDLEHTLQRVGEGERVERIVGLWALGALIQSWIGSATIGAAVPRTVTTEVAGWTTTGRLSVWSRGRLALTDRSGRVHAWVEQTLSAGAATIAAAPSCPRRLATVPSAHTARRADRSASPTSEPIAA